MTEQPIDVLIIGSGASGAAVAWSLAETRMRIVCLEQGDWMNPADYPSNGRDWEAREFGDYNISPNHRNSSLLVIVDNWVSFRAISLAWTYIDWRIPCSITDSSAASIIIADSDVNCAAV